MKILLIGGCGFIGSHIVDRCLGEGIAVRVLDPRAEAFRAPLPEVEYVRGDLSCGALLATALRGVDAVVHLAATTVPGTSNLDPAADIADNLIPTTRLIAAMRGAGVGKLVFFSSGGAVYGIPETDPVTEEHPLAPISSYGIVKMATEHYLRMARREHGLHYIALRPSNAYGPRQGHVGVQGVIGTCLWRLAKGKPVEIWGDGGVVRDFLHVRDLAELCCRALRSDAVGSFNAGSGEAASVAEIVALAGEVTGRDPAPVRKPGRMVDVPRIVLDIGKARATFDWQPAIPLREGMADMWDWVRRQPGA